MGQNTHLRSHKRRALRDRWVIAPIPRGRARGDNRDVSLTLQNHVTRRLRRGTGHTGPPASALFGRSVRLLDAADDLARSAGKQAKTGDGNTEDVATALAGLTSAFDALANTSLQLSLLARRLTADGPPVGGGPSSAEDVEQVTRLLFAAGQNVRIAARASEQALGLVQHQASSPGPDD
jgi:hypothetical protein